MKSAVILAVAVVMMMGQGAESLLGLLRGNSVLDIDANVNVDLDLDARVLARVRLEALASLEAAIVAGVVTRAQVEALLGLDATAFSRLWLMVDANVNGMLDVDELIDLELLIKMESLVDVDAGASLNIDLDINLGSNAGSRCGKWWSGIWSTRRLELVDFFKKRAMLKRKMVMERNTPRRGNILA